MGKGKFLDVDVWQKVYGEVSYKAICELYRLESGMKKGDALPPFNDMVKFLRRTRKHQKPNV